MVWSAGRSAVEGMSSINKNHSFKEKHWREVLGAPHWNLETQKVFKLKQAHLGVIGGSWADETRWTFYWLGQVGLTVKLPQVYCRCSVVERDRFEPNISKLLGYDE